MGNFNIIALYLLLGLSLIFILTVIFAKRPLVYLFCALGFFICCSIFYLLLDSPLFAAAQLFFGAGIFGAFVYFNKFITPNTHNAMINKTFSVLLGFAALIAVGIIIISFAVDFYQNYTQFYFASVRQTAKSILCTSNTYLITTLLLLLCAICAIGSSALRRKL